MEEITKVEQKYVLQNPFGFLIVDPVTSAIHTVWIETVEEK
jgi:hypothetical protein